MADPDSISQLEKMVQRDRIPRGWEGTDVEQRPRVNETSSQSVHVPVSGQPATPLTILQQQSCLTRLGHLAELPSLLWIGTNPGRIRRRKADPEDDPKDRERWRHKQRQEVNCFHLAENDGCWNEHRYRSSDLVKQE